MNAKQILLNVLPANTLQKKFKAPVIKGMDANFENVDTDANGCINVLIGEEDVDTEGQFPVTVTAVKEGHAIVTLTSNDNDAIKVTFRVTVGAALEGMQVSVSEVTLVVAKEEEVEEETQGE